MSCPEIDSMWDKKQLVYESRAPFGEADSRSFTTVTTKGALPLAGLSQLHKRAVQCKKTLQKPFLKQVQLFCYNKPKGPNKVEEAQNSVPLNPKNQHKGKILQFSWISN